jgi:hypothetical protein
MNKLKKNEPKPKKSEKPNTEKFADRLLVAARKQRAKSMDPEGDQKRAALRGCL